ncbi:hypothetical protein GYH30_019516 [Glycine max]|nr:hypothetical protein GYH30_019516 [Glycine max]
MLTRISSPLLHLTRSFGSMSFVLRDNTNADQLAHYFKT